HRRGRPGPRHDPRGDLRLEKPRGEAPAHLCARIWRGRGRFRVRSGSAGAYSREGRPTMTDHDDEALLRRLGALARERRAAEEAEASRLLESASLDQPAQERILQSLETNLGAERLRTESAKR